MPDSDAASAARAPGRRGRTGGTLSRSRQRQKAGPIAKIAMIVFTIGLAAIFADTVLFASGSRNLPMWINLTAILAPIGLAIGLVGMVLQARRTQDAAAPGTAD